MEWKAKVESLCLHHQLLPVTTCRKAQAKGKRPCVGNPSSASSTTTGRKAQLKGKRPCVGNPSSTSPTTTVMDDMEEEEVDIAAEGYVFWFQKPGAARPPVGSEAPGSPDDMDLSEYEAVHGTDRRVKYELVCEGGRVVPKVPRWAREETKMLDKKPDAGDPEEDHPDRPMTPESDNWEDDPFYKASIENAVVYTMRFAVYERFTPSHLISRFRSHMITTSTYHVSYRTTCILHYLYRVFFLRFHISPQIPKKN
ncbi:hypothetical protein L1987_31161 [Smallanthus sonchifolius]|uniref:Uncharacterized protein n=1 Tax=Smallanthus sonchifolius TaxID=185202 RepID=A0ACB9I614_9ASTR|nr:hypothetical protein L1987_31161 [Smallanthus sonchifolius]